MNTDVCEFIISEVVENKKNKEYLKKIVKQIMLRFDKDISEIKQVNTATKECNVSVSENCVAFLSKTIPLLNAFDQIPWNLEMQKLSQDVLDELISEVVEMLKLVNDDMSKLDDPHQLLVDSSAVIFMELLNSNLQISQNPLDVAKEMLKISYTKFGENVLGWTKEDIILKSLNLMIISQIGLKINNLNTFCYLDIKFEKIASQIIEFQINGNDFFEMLDEYLGNFDGVLEFEAGIATDNSLFKLLKIFLEEANK